MRISDWSSDVCSSDLSPFERWTSENGREQIKGDAGGRRRQKRRNHADFEAKHRHRSTDGEDKRGYMKRRQDRQVEGNRADSRRVNLTEQRVDREPERQIEDDTNDCSSDRAERGGQQIGRAHV